MDKSNPDSKTLPDVAEVLGLLDSFQASAALASALELGLFWYLGQDVCTGNEIAAAFELPLNRCLYWLQYLSMLGLLTHSSEGFSVSDKAKRAIVNTYSQETWALLARESMEQFPVFQFLPSHFHHPGSLWDIGGLSQLPNYIDRMSKDQERARRFTRMLFELHASLAEVIASTLDLNAVSSLMYLGGGSGVLSMALLRRYPRLTAVVVDIPNVCQAGQELAMENSFSERLSFHPANFVQDELPSGFDMVIECDVGVYTEQVFRKVRTVLNPGGRFVIIDQFAPVPGVAPEACISWALQGSVRDPDYSYPTVQEVVTKLENSDFYLGKPIELPGMEDDSHFSGDMYMIEVHI